MHAGFARRPTPRQQGDLVPQRLAVLHLIRACCPWFGQLLLAHIPCRHHAQTVFILCVCVCVRCSQFGSGSSLWWLHLLLVFGRSCFACNPVWGWEPPGLSRRSCAGLVFAWRVDASAGLSHAPFR